VFSLPPVHETNAAGNSIFGGCFFVAIRSADITNFATEGFEGEVSVTTDSSNRPTTATVTCWIDVNGLKQPNTTITATSTGVQVAVPAQIAVVAGDSDIISECEAVTYADFTTQPTTCTPATESQLPPQAVYDALNLVLADFVDPIVCPELVNIGIRIHGGIPGVLTIGPDGDVSVIDPFGDGINPIYDCPPY